MARQVCIVDGCERFRASHGYCGTHAARVRKHGNPFTVLRGGCPGGERAGNWGGAEITYKSAHDRVRRMCGPAGQHACPCGQQAAEWAYLGTDPGERVGVVKGCRLTYSTDPSHYQPMCRTCHRAFDRGRKAPRLPEVM